MPLKIFLTIVEIFSAVLLIAVILLQPESGGFSSNFGGPGGVYHAKRGAEKALFVLTTILALIFLGTVLASVIIK